MHTNASLTLRVLSGEFAVARLDAEAAVPKWALGTDLPLVSVTRTREELSIVAPVSVVPPDVRSSAPWSGLTVIGPLEFSLVGILAELSGTLARAGISLFAISTHDTDLLLVASDRLAGAVGSLRDAGHVVEDENEAREHVDD